MNNNTDNSYRPNYIRKGQFDKNNYKTNQDTYIDPKTQSVESLGIFKDNFSLQPPNEDIFALKPIPILYSRQTNQASFNQLNNNISASNQEFKLGDPYIPAHGSNLNRPGTNNPKFGYNQIDLMEDGVADLFRKIDNNKVTNITTRANETHNNEIDKTYNSENNFEQPIKKINEYEKSKLIDNNVKDVKETLCEYIIYVSSSDRDYKLYPNPFNYKVEFNPVAGTKQAYISQVFKNIKYINLKSVIVPRKYIIIVKNTFLVTNNPSTLFNDYISLFVSKSNNSEVMSYNKYINFYFYNNVRYYFYYYIQTIGGYNYYLSDCKLYLKYNSTLTNYSDFTLQNVITANILNTISNSDIILNFLNNIDAGPVGPFNGGTYDVSILINSNMWILIDKSYLVSVTTRNIIKTNNELNINGKNKENYYYYYYNYSNNGIDYILTNYKIYYDEQFTKVVKGLDNIAIINADLNKINITGYKFNNNSSDINLSERFASEIVYNYLTPTVIFTNKRYQKIKFSYKNNNFDEIINETYEFDIIYNETLSQYTIIPDSFKSYTLLNLSLENDRFMLLNIKEIDTNYEYATDKDLENAFSVLFPDYINGDYYYLDSSYHEKIYDHSILGNISKMTINFKNSSGTDINISYKNIIDYDIMTPYDKCICNIDPLTGIRLRNYQCYHSYLRHGSYEKLQNTLLFKVGVIECIQDVHNFIS